ncbi:MAG: hypothetical protein JNM84_27125 [Planctomycetes bacterium]|nr:hypothetical protein [Planctomycetota bacterium]
MSREPAQRRIDRGWLLATLLVAAIVLVRSFQCFAWPTLDTDDGHLASMFFADARFTRIFEPYNGSVTVLPHLGAWLAAQFPVSWWPMLYAAFAGTAAIASLSAFASRRFRVFVPSTRVRVLLCVLVALAPHGNARLVSALLWTHVSFGLLFALYALAPLPARGWRRNVDLGWRTLLACSSALTPAAVPLLLWRAWKRRHRSERWVHLFLVAAVFVYYALGCRPHENVRHEPLQMLGAFARLIDQRVIAEAVIGGAHWPALGSAVHPLAVAILLAVGVGSFTLRGPSRLFAVGSFVAIAIMSAAPVLAREHMGMPDHWWGQRYTHAQRVLFHLTAGILIYRSTRALSAQARQAFAIAGLLHAALLATNGSQHYFGNPTEGRRVVTFFAFAEGWRETERGESEMLRLQRPGWNITLR